MRLQWGFLNKALVCQSAMTAKLRAAALLVNTAVTALSSVWDYLIKALTALSREVPCLNVWYNMYEPNSAQDVRPVGNISLFSQQS